MKITFEDKVVIVTGASQGIGKATAIGFGKAGASVVVNYNVSKNEAEQVIREIRSGSGNAIAVQADVSDKGQVDRLVKTTLDAFGDRIDILVNNAGSLVERKKTEDMDEHLWDKVVNLNMKSVYLCSRAVIPVMKRNQYGRIINISSIAIRAGGGIGAGHYVAAKSGVVGLTKNLAKELARTGITVNAIAPGIITTRYHDRFTNPQVRANFKNIIPVGREGRPEEVAYAALFLASDYATYILGHTLDVNGGLQMN